MNLHHLKSPQKNWVHQLNKKTREGFMFSLTIVGFSYTF
jgi:hypothetical protein